jgi:ABC-type transporter MlaC component
MSFRHVISRVLGPAALVLSCTLFAGDAAADPAAAQTFVEQRLGQMMKLVEEGAATPKIHDAIDNMVDYDELAKRTLGKPCPAKTATCTNHWEALSAAQQTEVTGLLKQLVEKNVHKNLIKTKNYDISYRGSKEHGENLAKVRTEAKSKASVRDAPLQVDYVVLSTGDKYKAIDIVTEGSSMTKNYYDQFTRMLTTPAQGLPYLVQKLKDKIAAKEEPAKEAK